MTTHGHLAGKQAFNIIQPQAPNRKSFKLPGMRGVSMFEFCCPTEHVAHVLALYTSV